MFTDICWRSIIFLISMQIIVLQVNSNIEDKNRGLLSTQNKLTQHSNEVGRFKTEAHSYKEVFMDEELGKRGATNSGRETAAIDKKQKCSYEFVSDLSRLLNEFNITLNTKDIENLRTFVSLKSFAGNERSRLQFITILYLNNLQNDRRVEKTYDSIYGLESINKEFIFKNLAKRIVKTKLILDVKGMLKDKKSHLHITIEVDFKRNRMDNIYRMHPEKEEILSNLLGSKSKSKTKFLKVQKFSSVSIFIGSVLALISSILCGLSFALKKWSLMRMSKNISYYFNKQWWMGHSLTMVGDVLHFVAFSFAPAIVICTLQILTVLVTAVASSRILGEKMHKYGKLAFALSLGGCWVIVFHVPNEPHIYSIETFLYMLSSHIFLCYIAFISIVTVLLISYWIPKYGHRNSLSYTIQSAIFGSMIVVGLKGIFLGYTDNLNHWLPVTSFLVVAIFLLLQLEYLNKALAHYNTMVITTQYYVFYSAFVIIATSLLFKVWKTSSVETIFANFCGLLTIALGAIILTVFEESNATFDFSKMFAGPELNKYKK